MGDPLRQRQLTNVLAVDVHSLNSIMEGEHTIESRLLSPLLEAVSSLYRIVFALMLGPD